MKKIFGLMTMVAVMFAASCQKESLKVSAQGEVDVTFSVQLPEVLATKAISDGQKADVLYYMPYAVTANDGDVPVYAANAEAEVVAGQARVTVRLVKGETYKIVFWAQDEDCTAYEVSDMKNITVTYGTAGNDENRDAFYTCKTITVNADGTLSGLDADNKIRLYRPFAQINFGAVAEDWAMMAPFITDGLTSAVTFEAKVPTTLNGLTGEAGNLADAAFTAGPAPLGEELEANNSTYTWVSMNYILADARNTMNVEAVFTYDGGKSQTVSVMDVPFERNYRTNILGYFFTSQEVIDIIIVPGFVNAETGEENPDIIVATTAADLQEKLAEAGEGEEVAMTQNLEVPATESNGYGSTGLNVNGSIFNGNGHTLSVPGANTTWDSAVATTGGTIKNLTIDDGFRGIFVKANDNATKVYLENVVVDGPTYTISCDQASGNGLEATDCTFNGWTSYAATIGSVKFVDCNFGEGAGYAFCRPYAPTEFVGCAFEAGYQIDARAAITFENCTLDGVAVTAANLATLVTSNFANASVK